MRVAKSSQTNFLNLTCHWNLALITFEFCRGQQNQVAPFQSYLQHQLESLLHSSMHQRIFLLNWIWKFQSI